MLKILFGARELGACLACDVTDLNLIPSTPYDPLSPPGVVSEFRARSNTECVGKKKKKKSYLGVAKITKSKENTLFGTFILST